MKRLNIINFILIAFANVYAQQPTPDSLVGKYDGYYYRLYMTGSGEVIDFDTAVVTSVNLSECLCKYSCDLETILGNGTSYETSYYYCTVSPQRVKFYANDSIKIIILPENWTTG